MPIKLTPAVTSAPKNSLRVKLKFMHGDADAYTYTESTVRIPEDANKEELFGRILRGIESGLEMIDENEDRSSPFIVSETDWNSTNIDEETGIPLIGARLQFVHKIEHNYWTETEILVGTVSKADEDTVTFEFNGSVIEVPNNDETIAPESSAAIIIDGFGGYFKIGDVEVTFEGESDCTCEGRAAPGGINEVVYFDANGTEFTVSGY